MNLQTALDTITAALPPEVKAQQIQERLVNLAASGNALVLDLGVANLPEEQREATEAQVVAIAGEIDRLTALAENP